jgi:hypothetical protein
VPRRAGGWTAAWSASPSPVCAPAARSATADALRTFAADEILVATHPEARSHWLAHDLVARARLRFDAPVLHVVVDLDGRREYLEPEPAVRFDGSPTLTAS